MQGWQHEKESKQCFVLVAAADAPCPTPQPSPADRQVQRSGMRAGGSEAGRVSGGSNLLSEPLGAGGG